MGIRGPEFSAKMSEINRARPEYHGLFRTGIYNSWSAMIQRTKNESNSNYKFYGARGITVIERWKSFKNFVADMGPTWTKGLSIDRIDVNGNYEPGNCRWVTQAEQNKNTTRVKLYTYKGRTLNMAEWAKEGGMSKSALKYRLQKNGMSIEEALEKPLRVTVRHESGDSASKEI